MKQKTFTLTYPWDVNGYQPYVEYLLDVDDTGFCMEIRVEEVDPLREKTEHQTMVCEDSCVEWFANFLPEKCDRYFNFEINANGKAYASFRKDRYEYVMLTEEEIAALEIRVQIAETSWKVQYHVPFTLIAAYVPGYQFTEGMRIRTNFYKCGDHTKYPHYGIWNESPLEQPDYHRPEYFGDLYLD